MSKHYKLGFITFLGVVFIFLPLFILTTDTWSAKSTLEALVSRGGWQTVIFWQFIHFLLGCGLALLAQPTGERSLYFVLFVLFLFTAVLFNLNAVYGWGLSFLFELRRILGVLNVVFGFFSVMFTRCYTVRITAKRSY